MQTTGNTILITGGNSGIGRALAHRFHDAGNTVIVAGRNRRSLDETVEGRANMHAYVLDAGDPAAIDGFAARIVAAHPALNVLINNAGIMKMEKVDAKRDLADAEATIATNLLGPIRMTDALIDHLTAQDHAAIVNVSSGLAFVPLPVTPTYNATKAALHSYTVALRTVLEGRVEVIELVPPAVQTELTPGQSEREDAQPLGEFIDEVMALFARQPTPKEILVEKVGFLRNAEAEGRFDAALEALKNR